MAMRGRLLILGASGHGKVVGDCASAMGCWSDILYFDDRWPDLCACGKWSVVGNGADFLRQAVNDDQVFIAIGHAETRLAWVERVRKEGLVIATIIHPRACVSEHALVGPGTVIMPGAVVNIGARINAACIVNTNASIDHDCELDDGVHICPGVHLAGDVHVGEASWVGIGSVVRQCTSIGARVIVGAGAAVVSDIPDNSTYVGVPARPLK